MRQNYVEALIGAAVLVVAAFFFIMVYSSSQKDVKDGYVLFANFQSVEGINVGSNVKIGGVKVGVVKNITLNPETYEANVALFIDGTIKMPKDSSAQVSSEGFLGGKFISLEPGGSDTMLDKDGVIQSTQSSLGFESLIGKFVSSFAGDKK